MNPNCERNDERLLALLLDELEPQERAELEAHLDACEECGKELQSLRRTVGRLENELATENENPQLTPQRRAELKAGNVKPIAKRAASRSFNPTRWGMWAALALFGFAGLTVLYRERPQPLREDHRQLITRVEPFIPLAEEGGEQAAPNGAQAGPGKKDAMNDEAFVPTFEKQALEAQASVGRDFRPAEPARPAEERRPNLIRTGIQANESAVRPQTEAATGEPAAALAEKSGDDSPTAARSTGGRKEMEQRATRQFADAPQQQLPQSGYIEPGHRSADSIMPRPTPVPAPSPPNDAEFDAMYFQNYGVNPFIDTAEDPQSTFAADVDTASYTIVRNYLNRGILPPPEAVRVEEFVNYFEADYPAPVSQTFAVYSEVTPSPFREGYSLLRVGIKGREIPARERKPVVLTFVVDVSGSMAREDRLGLVKRTLATLLRELRPGDRVGLAVYGSRGEEILSHHDVTEEGAIERGIARLRPGGSTNAEEGLRIGYAMARRAFDPEAVNRVILCTDGVANVGRTGADSILDVIGREAEDRIYLTALGFGLGNYNDVLMEQLADKGNGHYAYLDTDEEALEFVRRHLAASMEVIAQDVKIQVELDPAAVRKYRLLGYENRDIADRDFRNDRVDAGEINAGHAVTALYELKLKEGSEIEDLGVVRLRFKDPDAGLAVREVEGRLDRRPYRDSFEQAGTHFRLVWIAAEFAEILRRSYWARELTVDQLIGLLDASRIGEEQPDAAGLRDLMVRAARLMPRERFEADPMDSVREDDRSGADLQFPPAREDEVRMLESPETP